MKLVILDRDGVINEDSDAYIKTPSEWQPIPGSLEAIVRLKNAGFRVVVASNQSGIGRGLFDYDMLFAIHDKMTRMLADLGAHIDGIFFCPHAPDAGCTCRKPETGLFNDIARRLGQSIEGCAMIGDSRSDMEAASAASARPIGVRTGKPIDSRDPAFADIPVYDDLAQAADALIAEQSKAEKTAET